MNDIEKAIEQLDMQIKCTVNTTSIKTCKLAIESLEKQIPKRPKNIRNILFSGTTKPNFSDGECPNCGGYVDTDDNRYVCGQSGCYQALDWSEDDE